MTSWQEMVEDSNISGWKILFVFLKENRKFFFVLLKKGKDKTLLGIEEVVSYVNSQDNSYTKQILIIMELKEKYNGNKMPVIVSMKHETYQQFPRDIISQYNFC